MRFSLYSEMQDWGEKSWSQTYDEVLEPVVNADRLGYDAYGLVEHFCFPKFSISPDPIAFFAACAQKTQRIIFRTLVHSLPYHNPVALASRIAAADSGAARSGRRESRGNILRTSITSPVCLK